MVKPDRRELTSFLSLVDLLITERKFMNERSVFLNVRNKIRIERNNFE